MRNYKFLEKQDAAIKLKNPRDILAIVDGIFGSDKLDILKEKIAKLCLADSAARIRDEAYR
ncbi:MAG: hypothetical protein A2Z72_08680 [Omnitrophica bacterium RBG_13_46_9]|nr:MAG: hypothetical protein A2Z72_08680 [Omnitrophica bacterium RBG_13_46_9]